MIWCRNDLPCGKRLFFGVFLPLIYYVITWKKHNVGLLPDDFKAILKEMEAKTSYRLPEVLHERQAL